jgi:hypothetical protein
MLRPAASGHPSAALAHNKVDASGYIVVASSGYIDPTDPDEFRA